jgi:hypothetical protein
MPACTALALHYISACYDYGQVTALALAVVVAAVAAVGNYIPVVEHCTATLYIFFVMFTRRGSTRHYFCFSQ